MQPSLWTSLYHQELPWNALDIMADQGWAVFELSCEHIGILARKGPKAVAKLAAAIDRLGVEMPQCHATILADVASLKPGQRARDLAAVHKDLDICADLGIANIVLHPGSNEDLPDQESLAAANDLRLAGFTELAEHCERVGTRIAIENTMDGGKGVWGKRRFGVLPEELLALIEQVGSPALGICWDTSHANVQALNQPEAIRTCGDKLIALHISDNDGSGDQHRTPGYGNIAWPPIIKALKRIGYPWHFNLEIPGELWVGNPARWLVDLRSVYAREVCEALLR